jgi:hypothetical protein
MDVASEPRTWAEDLQSYRQSRGSQAFAAPTQEHVGSVRCAVNDNRMRNGRRAGIAARKMSLRRAIASGLFRDAAPGSSSPSVGPQRRRTRRYTRSVPSLTPVGEPRHPMFGALAEPVHKPSG